MNTFKMFSLLLLGFVFAAIPLSNQGFCNGDPIPEINESALGCQTIIDGFSVSGDCGDAPTTYTLLVTVSAPAADGVKVTVTATGFDSGEVDAVSNGDGTWTATINNVPKDEALNVVAVGNGTNCTGDPNETDTEGPAALCTTCDDCLAEAQKITNTPNDMAGEEICMPGDDAFDGEADANYTTNGLISSPRTVVMTYNGSGSVTCNGGFEVALGATLDITSGSSCGGGAFTDGTNALVSNPNITTPVKVTPNPFNNFALIDFTLQEEGDVQMYVFNMKGERVAMLVDGYRMAGQHQVEFNASDLAKGFYYLTVRTANSQTTEKLVVVR